MFGSPQALLYQSCQSPGSFIIRVQRIHWSFRFDVLNPSGSTTTCYACKAQTDQ